MARIDITGKRYGALTAVRPVSSDETADHRPGWLVRCDCGREKVVNGSNLRRGYITSCGCGLERGRRISASLTAKDSREDLTGRTYYELTAVRYIRHDLWLWRCSCGKEVTARPSLVKTGKVQSCGHVLSATARKKIVTDNTVEHWDGTTVSRLRHIMSRPETQGIRVRRDAEGNVRYQARLMLRGKTISLGTFDSRAEAERARRHGEEMYYLPIIEAFDRMVKDKEDKQ